MKSTHAGIVLVIIGGALLLSALGLDINIFLLLIAIALVYFGMRMLFLSSYQRDMENAKSFVIPLEGAARAKIELQHALGKVEVVGGSTDGMIIDGHCTGDVAPSAKLQGDLLTATISVPHKLAPMLIFPWNWKPYHWRLGINPNIPVEMHIESGLSDSQIDLSILQVTKLRVETGLGSTNITMPSNAGFTDAKIKTGLGSADIGIPNGVAARIRIDGGLGDSDINTHRFPKNGKYYQSPDYETAANKIDLKIEYGLGSVSVK